MSVKTWRLSADWLPYDWWHRQARYAPHSCPMCEQTGECITTRKREKYAEAKAQEIADVFGKLACPFCDCVAPLPKRTTRWDRQMWKCGNRKCLRMLKAAWDTMNSNKLWACRIRHDDIRSATYQERMAIYAAVSLAS